MNERHTDVFHPRRRALHRQVEKRRERERPSLLIISGVKPFPLTSGQNRRVYNKLRPLRDLFEVTFMTVAPSEEIATTEDRLGALVDEALVLPSVVRRHLPSHLWHRSRAALHTVATGLRASNYFMGHVELSPSRVSRFCDPADYDIVLYEYWHTVNTVPLFQAAGGRCVLDMHDVLWRSYDRILELHPYPWMRAARDRLVSRYRQQEEAAWPRYDALIAISEGEAAYARQKAPDRPVFTAPMGTDLEEWPYLYDPPMPPRLAFYGSLGGRQNRESVQWCLERILPRIWQEMPAVEFWIVGANPPEEIRALHDGQCVHVTGYVEDVAQILAKMKAVLCPWRGTYGFRSRLIEVMAVGVPVVASPEAVHGMGLQPEQGIFLEETDAGLAERALTLLRDGETAQMQSRLARKQVEDAFSFNATYGWLSRQLYNFACGD